jgi:hypothetical protein
MRDYSKICPEFWNSNIVTNARLGDSSEMLVALYLMTAPASNALGLYRCPIPLIAHDTRMTIKQASEAIESLYCRSFLEFDDEKSVVYVKKMALYQIEKKLKAGDKRVIHVKRELELCASGYLKQLFISDYNSLFNLGFSDSEIESMRNNAPPSTPPSTPPSNPPSNPPSTPPSNATIYGISGGHHVA